MSKILDRLPILDHRTSPRFDGRHVTIHRNQILVWVSVHMAGILEPERTITKIPALIDMGNNFDFSIQHRHLREWAGIDTSLLPLLGDIHMEDRRVDRHEATVWLYPNTPGERDIAAGRPPFRLRMPRGIAVYPRDADASAPRVPLVGLAAFLNNDVDFWLDPELRHVSAQTRTWRRRLLRLLTQL